MENIEGVYNPEQRVEVQLRGNDDVWTPATIGYYAFGDEISCLVNYTVRFGDLITGLEIRRKPNEVFLDRNATINGTNTNIIPGSQIYTEDITGHIIPVTLVSKNYWVNTHDGRGGVVPHTRIRRVPRAAAQARPPAPPQAQAQAQPQAPATVIYTPGQRVEVDDNGVWRPGVVRALNEFTVRNTETGRNVNRDHTQVMPMRPLIGNRNIMPGDNVIIPDGSRWIPGTIVSRNYSVSLDDGIFVSVPHTELRLAQVQPQPPRTTTQARPPAPPPQARPPAPPPQARPPAPPPQAPATVIYTRGQRVEVDDNGVWRPGEVRALNEFTVRNPATGRTVNRHHTHVTPVTPLLGNRNIMPGDNVIIEIGNRSITGTIVSRNYFVAIDNGMIDSVPHTRMRLAQVQPQPRAQPRLERLLEEQIRISLEVHKAFQKLDFDKFMTIITKDNKGASDFKDALYPFQPLIYYINNNPSTTLDATEKTSLLRDLNGEIKTRLNEYLSNFPEKSDYIMEVIQFVMSQEPYYIDPYIRFLTFDCINAIGTGDPSCPKGVFEKAFLMNESVLKPLCSDDTTSASSTITCKPVYRELLDCFYDHVDLEECLSEWYEINNMELGTSPLANASEEARQEDFRTFVLSKAPRPNTTAINDYIKTHKKIFETLIIGGRRKQKTLNKGKRKTLNKDKRKTSNKGKTKKTY